jgi:phosphatidyl-myo-inositol dimannoside synthase
MIPASLTNGARRWVADVKPRVLTIASTFPRWKGDAEPGFVYDLARALPSYAITVLVPHYAGARHHELMGGIGVARFSYFFPRYQRLCYEGGIHENLRRSMLARLQLPFLVFFEMLSLLRMLAGRRYALVHAHWIIPHGFLAVILKPFFHVPVIVSAHAGDVFPFRNPVLRFFARLTLRYADAVTVNSAATGKAVQAIAGIPVKSIPMGVDLASFSAASAQEVRALRKRLGIGGEMVLSVGRLAEKKGLSYLVEAMPLLLRQFPMLTLLVVGDGPERSRIEHAAACLQVSRHVHFTGRIPNAELPAYYAAADVFVLPSIVTRSGDTEGLGVVLLEAIAAGTPVVASNVGGIPDIVLDRETGLLISQKDPQQLADAITLLLRSPSLAKKLSASARKRVEKNYSWQTVGRKFALLYRSVMRT